MKLTADFVKECESLIRSGRDLAVNRSLSQLNLSQVPRQLRLPIANICRRVSNISMGLRLLTPIVRRSKEDQNAPATTGEMAEYAILLQRAGSVSEALQLLDQIPKKEIPKSLLYKSFCHFNMWQYEAALPYLKEYLKIEEDPYSRLIGNVNLGAAYVALDQYELAIETLLFCIAMAGENQNLRLQANCHELLAQVYLLERQTNKAKLHLTTAEKTLESTQSLDHLFVKKCRAFFDSQLTNSTAPLQEFRKLAKDWPHAETVREADFFSLLIEFDETRFHHLLFGTCFLPYRLRVNRNIEYKNTLDHYTYGENSGLSIDITSSSNLESLNLKFGSSTHKVLELLLRDFYRPVTVNSFFAKLFPQEYFNIFTSPTRVHQAVNRARRWIEAQKLPLAIESSKQGYFLKVQAGINFRIPLYRDSIDVGEEHLKKLRQKFGENPFNAKEARLLLSLSSSALQRLLNQSKADGKVESYGASTSTVYYLKVS